MRFGFAVSPGLDITYESDADRAALVDKLLALAEHGVTWFLLLLDDIPMQPGLAPRHADLACGVLGALRAAVPEATLTVCPTEYVGMQSSPYLAALAAGLPRRRRRHVDRPDGVLADDLGRRRAGPSRGARRAAAARLGQLSGERRHDELRRCTSGRTAAAIPSSPASSRGVLCNPMNQPLASKVALATAAAFLSRPARVRRRRGRAGRRRGDRRRRASIR